MKPYPYDAFLSFAVEDKIEVATELYHKLEEQGLKVWYSGRELVYGISIQESIREGLNKSRYAVLIITKNYFKTNYAQQELGALWSRELDGHQVIIPVFHNISPQEVGFENPALAERWAVSTSIGLDKVAEAITNRISQAQTKQKVKKPWYLLWWVWLISAVVLVSLIIGYFVWDASQNTLSDQHISVSIQKRIDTFQENLEGQRDLMLKDTGGELTTIERVLTALDQFNAIKSNYRNYYSFSNGYSDIQFEKNVSPATGINFESWSPVNNYGFKHPIIHEVISTMASGTLDIEFIYFNTQPTTFEIIGLEDLDSTVLVTVRYDEQIRLAAFHYENSPQTALRKHTT
ncbi:MAG: toll/interleukin-1 receptor domain-containing protein, partial [Marinoscillum sp.]